jgi:D-alanine transaminase
MAASCRLTTEISVLDRGFIYGDGVYEVIPVYHRQPYRLRQHLARLQRSLDGIRLANPHTDAEWESIIRELVARTPFDDQGVYFQVTRGVAKRDHSFPPGVAPTVFMMSNPLPLPTRSRSNTAWRSPRPTSDGFIAISRRFHSGYAGAAAHYRRRRSRDGPFRNGFLTEASASNVFIVVDGVILVPPKDNQILPGITYDAALELAMGGGLAVEVRPIPGRGARGGRNVAVVVDQECSPSPPSTEIFCRARGAVFRKSAKCFGQASRYDK